jgi:hypothetical protein
MNDIGNKLAINNVPMILLNVPNQTIFYKLEVKVV